MLPSLNAGSRFEICLCTQTSDTHRVEWQSVSSSQIATSLVPSHVDCRSRIYVYDHQFFDAQHPNRGLFVLNGWWQGRYVGAEIAAVHLMGKIAKLLEAGTSYDALFEAMNIRGFIPFTEFGFV